MKRFHVHVAVPDLQQGVRFYSTVFGAQPSVVKPDYAKWMLDDPRVNFAISQRGGAAGIAHLGIQVDRRDELDALHAQLEAAGETIADQGAATCCYAKSEKGWVRDPVGLSWETFVTHGEATTYGERRKLLGACCVPESAATETSSARAPGKSPEPVGMKAGAAECCGERALACPCHG
jgi:catechol 2,3-dioxygenase-like lactoylglutathione lyase family enzyme